MSQAADRYSRALFELAKEQNSIQPVQDSLTELRNLTINSIDFRHFLSNPLLSYEERCSVLKALFEGKIPDLSFKFLLFITYKKRLSVLRKIIESFDHLYMANSNQIRAYVTTASPLEQEDRILINQRLHNKFQQNMLTRWSIDPTIIGGFRIFIQGKMYDYSFKSKLNHFFQQATQPT